MNAVAKLIVLAAAGAWTLAAGSALAQTHDDHGQHGQGHAEPHEQGHKEASKLPLCPVTGNPIDFSIKTMTDDGPVYFCCKMCIDKLEEDPGKYATEVAAQRAALKKMERVQVTCPVSGNPVDGKTFAMVDGQGVYFCCKRCVPAYEKDPAKYKASLEASYTYQTKCPVSGKKIDRTAHVDLPTGQRIYLCCPGCAEKLLKDPEKYASRLAEQGIKLDVKKLKTEGGRPREPHSNPDAGHP